MQNMNEMIKEYANLKYPIVGDYHTKRYGNDRMNEFIVNDTIAAFKTTSGLICGFEKPRIQKDFCFHDEGPQYDLYKELNSKKDRMKNYFLYENLKEIDQQIENLQDSTSSRVYGFYKYESGTCNLTWRYYFDLTNESDIEKGIEKHEKEPNFIPMSESDKIQTLEILKEIRKNFEKRLLTWWKKYGFEKLHTWTYWADA